MSIKQLVLLCGLISAVDVAAVDQSAFISLAGENRIQIHQFDEETGMLERVNDVDVPGAPGSLLLHPVDNILYAALRKTGKLASLRFDSDQRSLDLFNSVPVEVDPAYIRLDPTGKFLFSAYYVTGRIAVHSLKTDGSISDESVQWFNTDRNAHAIVPDPSGRFVMVPHTGPNSIFQFEWDSSKGELRPNPLKRIFTPIGSGPRHIVFHKESGMAYVDNEQGSSVTSFRLNSVYGTLSAVQNLATLPPDFKGRNSCADLELTPSGKFLYASNRGHDSIAGFSVNPSNGALQPIGIFKTEKTPRQFNISPTGRWMVVLGQNSGKAQTYRINSETGALDPQHRTELGDQPWWVLIVAR